MIKMIDPCNENTVWKEIKIDGNAYIILAVTSNNVWKVLLTNLIDIWTEILTEETVAQRCQELNPLLTIEEFDYTAAVTNLLNDITNHIAHASLNEIKLKSLVEDGVFKFSINLTKGTPQELWENVTKPLCLSSIELMRRHKILIDLIKRKDEEIMEYKAEGAELIRKNIETKVFNEDEFKLCIPTSDSVACINAFQSVVEFYKSIHFGQSSMKIEPSTASTRKSSTDRKRHGSSTRNHQSIPSSKSNVTSTGKEATLRNNERSPAITSAKKFKKSLRNIIV